MERKDPFRPAERKTVCPKCREVIYWNLENLSAGLACLFCGRPVTGHERGTIRFPFAKPAPVRADASARERGAR